MCTVHLLDGNVLIALIDRAHVQHDPAHRWFEGTVSAAWATCPLTQNAVLRIVGDARYPNSSGPPAAVVPLLARLVAMPGHRFWPAAATLLDGAHVDASRLLTPAQLTDTCLLMLAVAQGGNLATFDRRLVADAVAGGRRHVALLG